MSTETETKTEDTQAEEPMYCKVEDICSVLSQVTVSVLAIVNGINSSMEELSKRSNNSDDNED